MYRRLWGGTDLSFTLHCLFGCFFGKLALPSNRVNVKPACPKLGILYRPAAACSISLERLAPVVLLLLLLVRQGTASLEWGLGGWPGRADNGRSRFVLPILLTQRVASSASASCRLNRFAPPTTSQTRGHVVRGSRQTLRGWSWLTLLRRQPRGTIKARQCSIAVSHVAPGGKAVSLFGCGWTCRSRAMCLLAHRKVLMLQCVVTASDGTEECLCP